MAGLVRTVEPATEPITVAKAKEFARIDTAADDDLVAEVITACREYIEPILNRTFVTTTWELTLDEFPRGRNPICLPQSPLVSIGSITFVPAAGGVVETWSSSLYDTDTKSLVGRVAPAFGESYPAAQRVQNAVVVTFDAGDGNQAAQRGDVKLLMKQLFATNYDIRHRTTDRRVVLNDMADALVWELRVPTA